MELRHHVVVETCVVEDTYPLLLCGYKGLEARRHPEAQLVHERGLRLAVDLDSDPGFKGRVLWRRQRRTA